MQSVGGVAAAIIEFNSLPDTVRAAAQNHDFWALLGVGFIFIFVGRIKIRSERFEFCGAGIHALKDRIDTVTRALQTNGGRRAPPNLGELLVARAVALHFAQQIFGSCFDGDARCAAVHGGDLFNLMDEPRIDLGELADFLGMEATFHGRQQPVNAVGTGRC